VGSLPAKARRQGVPLVALMEGILYILFSNKLNKYYIGSTNDINRRLYEHNIGHSTFTKTGTPWTLTFSKKFPSLELARKEELRIKKCKSRKYIENYVKLLYIQASFPAYKEGQCKYTSLSLKTVAKCL